MENWNVLQTSCTRNTSNVALQTLRLKKYGKMKCFITSCSRKVGWIVKWYGKYRRNVSWIVERYGKYERKASWNVKW